MINCGFQDKQREVLIEIDSYENIINVSQNCFNIFGNEENEVIGLSIIDLIINGIIDIRVYNSNNYEVILNKKNGKKDVFDCILINKDNTTIVSLIEITKYKKSEESNKRFKKMLENTNDIIYLYEILPERKFIYINNALDKTLGTPVTLAYEDSELAFKNVHPDDLNIQYKKICGTTNFNKPMQMRMKDSEGNYVWFEDYVIPFYNEKGELEAISGFCRNIQDRKELERKLEELSFHDSLTGLFSSNYYHKQAKRLNEIEDKPIGVIVCDLDNLKKINDNLGHVYGDKLLINFGNLLKREIKDAVITRFGGDEFVILLENKSRFEIEETYYLLQKSMNDFNKCNQTIEIQASIGWAYSATSLGIIEKIFNIADEMMYENKINKRKSYIMNVN